jgi:hypothetical protein
MLLTPISSVPGFVSVTYTHKNGTAKTVNALVNYQDYAQVQAERGEYLEKRARITLDADDISEPNVDGDTVTLDGLEWGITGYKIFHQTIAQKGYILDVVRHELITKKVR